MLHVIYTSAIHFPCTTLLSFTPPPSAPSTRYIFALSLLFYFSVLHFHLVIYPRAARSQLHFSERELNLMSLKVFSHCREPLSFPTYIEFERISCLGISFFRQERDDIRLREQCKYGAPRKVSFRRFPTRSEFGSDRGKKFVTVTNQQTFYCARSTP